MQENFLKRFWGLRVVVLLILLAALPLTVLIAQKQQEVRQRAEGPTTSTTTQPFSRVFVTSTTYNGNLNGLSGADAKCQERATAAGLGGTWMAWLSDSNTAAASRLLHNSVPYKLLDGTIIANDWADLTDGRLSARIVNTEFNNIHSNPSTLTWTNTVASGVESTSGDPASRANCAEWTADSGMDSRVGQIIGDGYNWTSFAFASCSTLHSLYCFEQTSVTPPPTATPIPPTATLTPILTPVFAAADVDRNGCISISDFSAWLYAFQHNGTPSDPNFRPDVNNDGSVSIFDFNLWLAAFQSGQNLCQGH